MGQYNATTQKGTQCKKRARVGSDYCRTHADEELLSTGQLFTVVDGAIGFIGGGINMRPLHKS